MAIYAALVASAGLAWQIFTWRHSRRPHLSVDLWRIATTARPDGVDAEFRIRIVNHSDRDVVCQARIEGTDIGGGDAALMLLKGERIGVLAHDAWEAVFSSDPLVEKGFRPAGNSIRATVLLPTGESFRSPTAML